VEREDISDPRGRQVPKSTGECSSKGACGFSFSAENLSDGSHSAVGLFQHHMICGKAAIGLDAVLQRH
jgi:hypothetical protein